MLYIGHTQSIKVYMKVSDDEYQLPLGVADTVDDLSKIVVGDRRTIQRGVNRFLNGKKSQYVCVDVDLDAQETKEYREKVQLANRRAGIYR